MKQNSYETVIIFTPVLSEEGVNKTIEKYRGLIKDTQGTMVEEVFWGLRQLAYPIQKKTTGIYWLCEYQANADVTAKLEVEFKRDEKVMRHLTTRLDKHSIEYNYKKRNGLIGKKAIAKTKEETNG